MPERRFFVCAAADIEEICRLAAVELDNIHGRHRQTGAVTMHAILPSREIYARSYLLASTSRGSSSSRSRNATMSFWRKKRVAVEVHLGVERHYLAFLGDNQWIDFGQRSVALSKAR
jgi:hypothetical protein